MGDGDGVKRHSRVSPEGVDCPSAPSGESREPHASSVPATAIGDAAGRGPTVGATTPAAEAVAGPGRATTPGVSGTGYLVRAAANGIPGVGGRTRRAITRPAIADPRPGTTRAGRPSGIPALRSTPSRRRGTGRITRPGAAACRGRAGPGSPPSGPAAGRRIVTAPFRKEGAASGGAGVGATRGSTGATTPGRSSGAPRAATSPAAA